MSKTYAVFKRLADERNAAKQRGGDHISHANELDLVYTHLRVIEQRVQMVLAHESPRYRKMLIELLYALLKEEK